MFFVVSRPNRVHADMPVVVGQSVAGQPFIRCVPLGRRILSNANITKIFIIGSARARKPACGGGSAAASGRFPEFGTRDASAYADFLWVCVPIFGPEPLLFGKIFYLCDVTFQDCDASIWPSVFRLSAESVEWLPPVVGRADESAFFE